MTVRKKDGGGSPVGRSSFATRSEKFASAIVTRGRLAKAREKGASYDLLAGLEKQRRRSKNKTGEVDDPAPEYLLAVQALCREITRQYRDAYGDSLDLYRSPQPTLDIIADRPSGRVFAKIVRPRTIKTYREEHARFRVGDLLSVSDRFIGHVFDFVKHCESARVASRV